MDAKRQMKERMKRDHDRVNEKEPSVSNVEPVPASSSTSHARPSDDLEDPLAKRARIVEDVKDSEDEQIDKILEEMVRNPYEDDPGRSSKRDRDESEDVVKKTRRLATVDEEVDIGLVENLINNFEEVVVNALERFKEFCFENAHDNVNGEGHMCPNCDKGRKADDENRHNKTEQREVIMLQYTKLNTYLKRILNSLVVRCKQPIGDGKTCGKAFKLKNRKKHYRYKCSAFIYYECTAKICRIRN